MYVKNHTTSQDLFNAPYMAIEQLGKQLGATMILAPHPDDESLGCGGLIQYLTEQDVPLFVCFVTSGGASHRNSISYPSQILTEIREQEAINACKILGVDSNNIIFLRQNDAMLSDLQEDEKAEIVSRLSNYLKEFDIDSFILPWRRDPHPDHMASYELGKHAVKMVEKDIQILEYPIWLWKNSQPEDWPLFEEVEIFRIDVRSGLSKKKNAIFAHQSQTSDLIKDDPQGFILTEDLLAPFLSPDEFFFFPVQQEIPSLEVGYFEVLYANNPDPWNFKDSEYENLKYKKINSFLENRNYDNGLELGCSIGVHTTFIAEHCKNLLAVDINESAIANAKELNPELSNVDFQVMDILTEFPVGPFEFISMCEMGYYFNRQDLLKTFQNIANNLGVKGNFLMVHWTSFVREYPLTGKLVHEIFQEFNQEKAQFSLISQYTHERYELLLWEKKS